jgi:S1-C subfamily serine protease
MALQSAEADNDGETVGRLRRELRSATEALTRQQLAASLDFRAIERANRSAITRIFVEAEDGTVVTSTGFAVGANARIVTAAHVIAGPDRTRTARRIAVQFSDSEQVFPARLIALSDNADLALLRVDNLDGEIPTVVGFNERTDTLTAGTPVAAIGFPMGGDVAMPTARGTRLARPLMWAGYVTAVSDERIDVRGYGAAGASGSPVFDANGHIVAVLFGGTNGEAGHTVVGVPAATVRAFVSASR